ncbi:hypothetical protein GWI33_014579 [Rhynchophorus ferrugineus]|uniref:Uncharacterized protein n=1 Tax=Rhynchophorus ferrugineus TaxID=354439 RepID=A0A834MAI9_RHYFE|nr:hypothetical protein GWI33_014579 [Rhynchophorus ferrugineus]
MNQLVDWRSIEPFPVLTGRCSVVSDDDIISVTGGETWTWSRGSTDAFRDMVDDKLLKGKLKHSDDVNKYVQFELDEYYNQTGGRNLIGKSPLD